MEGLDTLPPEMLDEIVGHLPSPSVLSLTSTSRYHNQFRDERFWKRLVTERFAGPDDTLYFPEDADEDSMWKSLFEVQSKQRAKARVFPVVDKEITGFLNHCRRFGEHHAEPPPGPRVPVPKSTGATRDNTLDGALSAASVLSATRLDGLKRRGMKNGDVAAVSITISPNKTQDINFFYSERKDLLIPAVVVGSDLVVPAEFEAIRDFPIRHWDAVGLTEMVRCDLSDYADEVWDNLVEASGNGSLYRSHFGYRRDHTGHDNRYDVVFYQPSRSGDQQGGEPNIVLDADTLNRILDVGLFRFADVDLEANGLVSPPVGHDALYFNIDELEMLEGELEL